LINYLRALSTSFFMVGLSCIVLAGGRSIRMGVDKRGLRFGGETFLDIALRNARSISEDVIVSLGSEDQVDGSLEVARLVYDDVRERGPLYGLTAALKVCKRPFAALLPVDAPLLNPEIYGIMVDRRGVDDSIEAVVPHGFYGLEPLYGVYRVKSFRDACEWAVSNDLERVVDAVGHLNNTI